MRKKLLVILIALPMIGFGQNVNIPDADFKAYLVNNAAINTNGDTEIQVSEATNFSDSIICITENIYDLTGIEAFTALTYLNCSWNGLTSLDVSQNIALEFLNCAGNQLTGLDVSNNTNLTYLFLGTNQLTSLDLSNNLALTYLNCSWNGLTSLDVSQNIALEFLNCAGNQLTGLDVSNNTNLTYLFLGTNQLTSLDLSNNLALTDLNFYTNQLTSLDVSQNIALTSLDCGINQLTSLDVSQNTALVVLHCSDNPLTSLDLRNGTWHTTLGDYYMRAYNNPSLTCINVDDTAWSATNWTFANNNIDTQHYFSTNCSATGIQEHTTYKELLKVTDLLGRETKQTNRPLFYIYNDGTVEKRIVIE